MTAILFVAVLILGLILFDTRKRLTRLEHDVRDTRAIERHEHWRALNDAAASEPVLAEPLAPLEPETPPPALHISDERSVLDRGPARIAPLGRNESEIATSMSEHEAANPDTPEDISPVMTSFATESEAQVAPESVLDRDTKEPDESGGRAATGFEDLFGRRLPIWAGGVTLLVAAVLLVKYSIDAGLLSPWVRVMLGLTFGAGLTALAEITRRMERFVQDERAAQSLAGAGIGAFYAATLAGANLYHLIAPGAAFAGLSAITAFAMGLALRFGAPCAVLALVGGLATPALIQSGPPNIPLLSGYLAMVIGSLTILSRRQRWFWLGAMALAGGMSWTALIIVMGELSQLSILAIGLLALLIGIAMPVMTASKDRGIILHAIASAAAALQLGLLVSQGGYDALSWGLYGLLSLTFLWLTQRLPALRPTMVLPLGISLVLAYVWPAPPGLLFAVVIIGIVIMFGGGALGRLWYPGGSIVEASQIAAIAIGGYFLTLHHPFETSNFTLAWLGGAFAALPALGAALGWRSTERQKDWRFPLLALSSGFLLIWAANFAFDGCFLPVAVAGVSVGLLLTACRADDERIANGALLYLSFALLLLVGSGVENSEIARLGNAVTLDMPAQSVLRWGLLALAWSAFAWRYAGTSLGNAVTSLTAALAYGAVAQITAASWLAIASATGLLGLALIARQRFASELASAMLVLGGIALLWTIAPLSEWLRSGMESLAGTPMVSSDLPTTSLVMRILIVPAMLGGIAIWLLRGQMDLMLSRVAKAAVAVPALVGCHCLYKLVFAIESTEHFITLGLAERTLWETLLIVAGITLWRWAGQRDAALLLVILGLAHNLFYSLLLHDPFWSLQAVGGLPLANLLLPTFAIGLAAPCLVGMIRPDWQTPLARSAAPWHMFLILLFAYASLRQLFCGSVFANAPVGQLESIFWSVLAIAMAIGWLIWGINRAAHSWRIGSLALMLAAIAKVFLIDAAGLEGLLRVTSFLALGFSLIGIGWLYSRFLRDASS